MRGGTCSVVLDDKPNIWSHPRSYIPRITTTLVGSRGQYAHSGTHVLRRRWYSDRRQQSGLFNETARLLATELAEKNAKDVKPRFPDDLANNRVKQSAECVLICEPGTPGAKSPLSLIARGHSANTVLFITRCPVESRRDKMRHR